MIKKNKNLIIILIYNLGLYKKNYLFYFFLWKKFFDYFI